MTYCTCYTTPRWHLKFSIQNWDHMMKKLCRQYNVLQQFPSEEVGHGHATSMRRWIYIGYMRFLYWKTFGIFSVMLTGISKTSFESSSGVDSKYPINPVQLLGHLGYRAAWTWTGWQRSCYQHSNCKPAQPEASSRHSYLSNSRKRALVREIVRGRWGRNAVVDAWSRADIMSNLLWVTLY